MDNIFIYGKVKKEKDLKKVISSEEDIFDLSDVPTSAIDYNPDTLIEPEEFYQLTAFSQKPFASDFIQEEISSTEFNEIESSDFNKLDYICVVQGDKYFFQVINTSCYVRKRWFSFSEIKLYDNAPIITLNDASTLIYDRGNDTLYFKKLAEANRVFKGMNSLYREATTPETQAFLDKDFLEISPSFDVSKVSIPNRKRIALISDTLNQYNEEQKQVIYSYTGSYEQVKYEDGKFKIESDNDLKHVLYGIEQRYFTTHVGGEKRIANSIIPLQQ